MWIALFSLAQLETGDSFRRKTTPYRANRQNDIFVYWRVHTTYLLPSALGFVIVLRFQE